MKKRVAGGVVLVAIGIGIWLSNLFNGLGPGGSGTNVGLSPEVTATLDTAEETGGGDSASTSTVSTAVTLPPVVVIDAQEYFLQQQTGESADLTPTSLEEIVELATTATPDRDGIRVHIKRRGSSRHSAEAALDAALHKAGITDAQIQRHAGLIE